VIPDLTREFEHDVMRQPRTLVHRIFGWIAAGLAVIFAIAVVAALVKGDFGAAIGGVIVMALLGWVAWDWTGILHSS
jgi:hypothetical protein